MRYFGLFIVLKSARGSNTIYLTEYLGNKNTSHKLSAKQQNNLFNTIILSFSFIIFHTKLKPFSNVNVFSIINHLEIVDFHNVISINFPVRSMVPMST